MKKIIPAVIVIIAFLIGGNLLYSSQSPDSAATPLPAPVQTPENQEVATFAGGCFWCTEAAFQELDGVSEVISGYAGGTTPNPTYEQVYKQQTDHREAVQIFYDPDIISYDRLLEVFWPTVNPTDDGGQFVDRGFSYTTAIYYHNDAQKVAAEQSLASLALSGRYRGEEIVTPVLPHTVFFPAEEYHQDFYLKSAERYKSYSDNSGRDEYKAAIWAEIEAGAE